MADLCNQSPFSYHLVDQTRVCIFCRFIIKNALKLMCIQFFSTFDKTMNLLLNLGHNVKTILMATCEKTYILNFNVNSSARCMLIYTLFILFI